MKRDCPHCGESMGGRFVRWSQLGSVDRSRNCPLCGGNIEFRMYPEELAARVGTILAVMGACYWANARRSGYLQILVTLVVVLGAIYVAMVLRLKDRQRYQKARLR